MPPRPEGLEEVQHDFEAAVTVTREQLERWLGTEEDGDVTETRWRYSLMSWGHDPLAT